MDGGGRLAGPLSGTEPSRPAAAGSAGVVSRQGRSETRRESARAATGRRRGRSRFVDRLVEWLSRLPRHSGKAAAALILAASAGYGAVCGGHVDKVAEFLAQIRDQAANAAGFHIAGVAVSGHRHLSRDEVLATAGVTGRASLLFFDVADARVRLLTNPWISAATVQKLLPDRLVIEIAERQAFALWQNAGRVSVIADDGTILEPYVMRRYAHLPLVVGNGADKRAKEFLDLLDRHPELRANVRASVLVAERRWNLRLKNGLDVRLPEFGIDKALDQMAALERDAKLSGRDIAAIDLRLPDRITVRLTDAAAERRDDAQKKKLQAKQKGGSA
jgi:cell division protein FtsQ